MGIYQLGNCNTLISINKSAAGGVAGLFSAPCRRENRAGRTVGMKGGPLTC
jgi:hypothetical protein